jgi:hypothetical protein
MDIRLATYMGCPEGWGYIQGRQVREALCRRLLSLPDDLIIRVSLNGVRRADVPFCRESVIELARDERRRRGFCLTDAVDQDLLDNWDGAAVKLEQPLFVWNNGVLFRCLGPSPSVGLREMLRYVLGVPVTQTSEAATALHLKVPNACNKLNHLWQQGYILRRERRAGNGGVEFAYLRIS